MKKLDLCSKTRSVWDMKTEKPSETSVDEGINAYNEANKKLMAFRDKIILDDNPKIEFPIIKARARSRVTRTITIKALKKNENSASKPELVTNLHYLELDQKFIDATKGKISLNNLNSGSRNSENVEEDNYFTFDIDNKFSESFKMQVSQLKIREDSLKKKYCSSLNLLNKSQFYLKSGFNGGRAGMSELNSLSDSKGKEEKRTINSLCLTNVPKRKKVISITEPLPRMRIGTLVCNYNKSS